MIDYYKKISGEFDPVRFKKISEQIAGYESSFCYKGFRKSAFFCAKKLKQAGAEVKITALPADGKTSFLDYILPQAFDVNSACLELIEPKKLVLANLKEEPFCVANRCGSTPEGGLMAEVIEAERLDKEDIKGKIVFTKDVHPKEIRSRVVEKGGIGIISSFSRGPDLQDSTWWANGWGSGPGWYLLKEDKKIFCFSISPGKGEYLKSLFRKGRKAKARVEVSSRIYAGKIHTVSGFLPGSSAKEITFLAHIYEPMITDNATGAAALIEICRILNVLIKKGEIPPPRRGIRFLLSMEKYGFAEFFSGKENRKKTLCAINTDSISTDIRKTLRPVSLRINPSSHPFFGDFLLEDLTRKFLSPFYPWKIEKGNFSDDTWICDGTVGIPVNWLWSHPGKYHHNSLDAKTVDFNLARNIASIIATYAYLLAAGEKEAGDYLRQVSFYGARKRRLDFYQQLSSQELALNDARIKRAFFAEYIQKGIHSLEKFGFNADVLSKTIKEEEKSEWKRVKGRFKPSTKKSLSPKDKTAKNIIPKRRGVGAPFCLVNIPFSKRRFRPEGLDLVLNWMDGKRNLLKIFELAGLEREKEITAQERAELIKYIRYLSKYGYLSVDYRVKLTKKDIKNGLSRLGVNKGDRIILHLSLAGLGYVKGGPRAICLAVMELIADKGVVMMPSFNHGKAFEETGYYSPLESRTTNGAVPDTFWRMKDVFRSLNPTHAAAVWGKDARSYVEGHHRVLTMGEGSPLHLLEKTGGKVVIIDVPSANTFHHVVEMTNNVSCLGKRTEEIPVKLPSGKLVKCRTWAWRNGQCPVSDVGVYLDIMRKKGMLEEGRIGTADVLVFRMSDCRKIIERLLKGEVKGFTGCKGCKIKPRVRLNTVKSDWDNGKKVVKPASTAFTGKWMNKNLSTHVRM